MLPASVVLASIVKGIAFEALQFRRRMERGFRGLAPEVPKQLEQEAFHTLSLALSSCCDMRTPAMINDLCSDESLRPSCGSILSLQMPLINVRTNLSDVQAPDALLKKLSTTLANATGKPESYVMTLLNSGVPMTFAGSDAPCAYVEIKSIGALTPPAMSDQFCELIQTDLGISKDRIYIGFTDINASDWGWNGRTFG